MKGFIIKVEHRLLGIWERKGNDKKKNGIQQHLQEIGGLVVK